MKWFVKNVTEKLFGMQDKKYRDFQCKLMPTVLCDRVIGVRTPDLRKFAKELYNSGEYEAFLNDLPHKYYEEDNLHGFITEQIKDFDKCIAEIERFLPYVDNWATCDSVHPRCFKKQPERLLPYIEKWLNSPHIYTVRFGIGVLMTYFLDDHFTESYPKRISEIKSDEYYVNMMIAWYFATALAKQWEAVIGYIENSRLPVWVHNKTIQKAVESYRITPEQKAYLKAFRK